MKGFDQSINDAMQPITDALQDFIFYEVELFGYSFPWIVMWLVVAALFFTFYFRFINVRGFRHAFDLLRGHYDKPKAPGEITHFQALMTALSGTVGIGNIGGVAIIITIGGPGAFFWMLVAGFLGMATKFGECILGVMYRQEHPDGSVSGGPMYYLEYGLKERGLHAIARPLGVFYALAMVIACLGIGNMFQSNQAYEQFLFVTGGEESMFMGKGWLFGTILAIGIAAVIIGGIKSIAKVTSRMVPFMAVGYVVMGLVIIAMNIDQIPWAVSAVFTEAFAPEAIGGGMIGVMMLGFKRAVFSNEAGIGSAAIAHAAVKTSEPVTEGYVALMGPFIDTIVISSITAMIILTTVYDPSLAGSDVQGVQLTAQAFSENISWSVIPLSLVAILFAFSTIISWSYYGLKGWTYLFGNSEWTKNIFRLIFCAFVALGCMIQLDAVLDFSDALVFVVALPNIIGLYIMAPVVRKAVLDYQRRLKNGEIAKYKG